MFRSISVSFVIFILLQTAFAVPVNNNSKTFVLTDKHIVPKSEAQNLELPNSYQNDWIGNTEIGAQWNNDTLYRGIPYTLQNNVNSVVTITLTYRFSDERQKIHYVKVVNDNNSYAVICADSRDLGFSYFPIAVRVAPLSTSMVIPVFGASL